MGSNHRDAIGKNVYANKGETPAKDHWKRTKITAMAAVTIDGPL